MKRTLFIALSALSFSSVAIASDVITNSVKSYVVSLPYYMGTDEDRRIDDAFGNQFAYGHHLKGNWYIEGTLSATVMNPELKGLRDAYQGTHGLDFAFRPTMDNGVTPYFVVGGGISYNKLNNGKKTAKDGFANIGGGLVTRELFNSGLHLRGDVRYIYDDFKDGFGDWRAGIGIEAPIGVSKVVTREVEVPVVQVKHVPVPASDSDNDGVVDGVDRCPNTLKGAKVDQYGCVVKAQVIKLEGVFFEFNSAKLTQSSLSTLNGVAASLKGQPGLQVVIAGHTDSLGDANYNQKLSQARSMSVFNYLVARGVDSNTMSPKGYGESKPLVSNDTKEGRQKNRRVEFVVIQKKH